MERQQILSSKEAKYNEHIRKVNKCLERREKEAQEELSQKLVDERDRLHKEWRR
jgi:hypothetical protein